MFTPSLPPVADTPHRHKARACNREHSVEIMRCTARQSSRSHAPDRALIAPSRDAGVVQSTSSLPQASTTSATARSSVPLRAHPSAAKPSPAAWPLPGGHLVNVAD